ncbi:MAG: thiolase family protein [Actinobacteria bacterium]|jgi:hypothetical protein|uniref:Unannotated protein n=1 Tax=freshwater metagenome TaxID=449393 RepID=A0A6J7IUQ0_9ZZZZ|nr:thiolase family protein [Actinomycetota bacterium]
MSVEQGAWITGVGQTPYLRKPDADLTTEALLADAAQAALSEAGLRASDVDGLAVASFTLAPDRAIDLAAKLGLRLRWIMDSGLGGASGVDMLQHSSAAVRAGDARNILCLGGDCFTGDAFTRLINAYNRSMIEDFEGFTAFGPNAMFALLTTLQMSRLGLERADYGALVCRQRESAAAFNANAAYRTPLTIDDYLAAPVVAEPLTILDCVPVVSGANAITVGGAPTGASPVRIASVKASYNHDNHLGDGLTTGLSEAAGALWEATGWDPSEIDVLSLYDDYPAVVVAQLIDAGFIGSASISKGDTATALRDLLLSDLAINSSGGQLSAGQCGAGAGLHGVVDACRALVRLGRGGRAFVAGYGMVVHRFGACSNAAALEIA